MLQLRTTALSSTALWVDRCSHLSLQNRSLKLETAFLGKEPILCDPSGLGLTQDWGKFKQLPSILTSWGAGEGERSRRPRTSLQTT